MKVSYFSGIYIYQNVNSSPLKQAFLDQRQVRLQISTFFGGIPKYKKTENSLPIRTGHTIHMHYTTNIFSHNKNHIFLSPEYTSCKREEKTLHSAKNRNKNLF